MFVVACFSVMYPDLTEAVMSQGFSADDTISDLMVDQVLAMHKVRPKYIHIYRTCFKFQP